VTETPLCAAGWAARRIRLDATCFGIVFRESIYSTTAGQSDGQSLYFEAAFRLNIDRLAARGWRADKHRGGETGAFNCHIKAARCHPPRDCAALHVGPLLPLAAHAAFVNIKIGSCVDPVAGTCTAQIVIDRTPIVLKKIGRHTYYAL